MKHITKLFQTKIKSIDEQNRQVTFCFSDDQTDRMGEIVDQASWDVKSYEQNPLILWGHNPDEPENVLGRGISLDLNKGGKSFVTAQFDDESVNPKAGLVFRQLLAGTLRCVSAGFIPHTIDTEDDTPVLKDNELLEISIVPIPANPRAVALGLKDGSISRKDAEWLLKSMRSEAEALEAELVVQEVTSKEKTMNDETAKALIDSVKSLSEKIDEFQTKTNERFEGFEAKLAEVTKSNEEPAEEEVSEEEPVVEDETTTPAKGGSDDQPGAGEDEFDDDTELTPEQEAEMDAKLAEELAALESAA